MALAREETAGQPGHDSLYANLIEDSSTYLTPSKAMKDPADSSPGLKGSPKKASLLGSIFNLTKTAMGAGLLSLPRAFALAGLLPGFSLILFCGFFTGVSLHLLARCSAHTGATDYVTLATALFSRRGSRFFTISIIVVQLVLLMAPLIALPLLNGHFARHVLLFFLNTEGASLVPNALEVKDSFFATPAFLTGSISLLFIFPLCLLKNVRKLSFASFLGLLCLGYVAGLTIFEFFRAITAPGGLNPVPNYDWYRVDLSLMTAFNAFVLAFCSHPSMLTIVTGMQSPTTSRSFLLSSSSQLIISSVYLLTCIFAYLRKGYALTEFSTLLDLDPNAITTVLGALSEDGRDGIRVEIEQG
jgi:amino acid permease